MTNPYLRHTKYYKSREDQFGIDFLSTLYDDTMSTLDTSLKFWKEKGVGGGLGEFVSEAADYSSTQEQAKRTNKHRWEFVLGIANKYRDAGPWPANIPRRLFSTNSAYPNLPSVSQAISIAPNSIACVYAQSALFSYLTAKLFDKPKFIELGDKFAKAAKTADKSILGKGSIKKRQKAQELFLKQWMALAVETNIISNWYDLIGQLKNLISGEEKQAVAIKRRLTEMQKTEELVFADQLTKDTSSSIWDLFYIMRGWIGLAGLILLVVFGTTLLGVVAAYVPGAGAAVGRFATTAGRGAGRLATSTAKSAGKLASSTVRFIGNSAKSGIEDAIKQGITDKDMIENMVARKLQSENENVSEQDIRRIIKQQLGSLK